MATIRWTGTTASVAQVTTITIGGTVAVADTISVTIGNAVLSIVTTGNTPTLAATQLQEALTASSAPPEHRELNWTSSGAVVTGIAKTAGVPHTISATANNSATATVATPTAATGPNFANVAANYSGGSLPSNGDTLIVEKDTPSIRFGLTGLSSIALAKVRISAGYGSTGESIGLPDRNVSGYREYRVTHLQLNATELEIGEGDGSLPSVLRLNLQSVATNVTIYKTGVAGPSEQAVQLIGGSSATAFIESGNVGIATNGAETANFSSIKIGANATLKCGDGATHTTIESSGNLRLENSVTTLNLYGGEAETTGQVTTLNVKGGSFTYRTTSTITTASVGPGTIRLEDSRARTFTTLSLRAGATVSDPLNSLTIGTLSRDGTAKVLMAQ